MLSRARLAVDDKLVTPFYQPKIDLRTGRVVGFEALLRCCPPDAAPFGPARIAAAFHDAGLAAELGSQLVGRVIADLTRWTAQKLPFGHVAINAAASELQQPNFADRLLLQLRAAKVDTGKIQIEVTESALLGKSGGCAERQLAHLAKAGVKVALDDFGTGYASLSHLRHYPVNVLKIDRSFVRDLLGNRDDQAIVRTVLGLAHALDLEVVAEGVETNDQRMLLQGMGCNFAQGYLFGRAVPALEVEAMLRGLVRSAAA
jgi:EAL domain-containing protein (putative c-di-GMP-specific phosphodiesterase class I)